ncbi:MAG: hypothetical protein Edafosvirus13_15 [Edafosvirus sp.]|uniref:Uncharacterized protein n=1 Tax=Edafosvirus sp. TaxID=2487765 RepID=A0A3G4ZU68_9VIRU|nr:MAG: hypothetical protein Edafosvirus13_15 [Edafosvirus sp.]
MDLTYIIIFIIIIGIVYYFYNNRGDVVYTKSDIDDQLYLVRELKDKQKAANMLARLKQNIMTLTNYLVENKNSEKFKPYIQYIDQLAEKIKNVVITESAGDSIYTSYSVNKGEEIVFCLRSRKNKDQLHDLNLIMYVALHEMAHVACPEFGHTELFKKIFAFLTNVAVELGLYKKMDFDTDPAEYCGLTITDSII